MKRMLRRQLAREGEHKLEMTSMIDVTFLLLIFFMCTLKFKTLEGKLETHLPKDVGVNLIQAEPPMTVDLRMDVIDPGRRLRRVAGGGFAPYTAEDAAAQRRYVYSAERQLQYRVGPFATQDPDVALQHVAEMLPKRRGVEGKPAKVTIEPRAQVTQKEVVEIVDGLVHLGVQDVTFKQTAER